MVAYVDAPNSLLPEGPVGRFFFPNISDFEQVLIIYLIEVCSIDPYSV